MYRLFQDLPAFEKGKTILPEFIYVKGFYLRQLALIQEYYHENIRNVPNQHILARLLLSMNVSTKRDIRNYVDTAADQMIKLSSQLRMTSALNHGFAHEPGHFYGPKVTEVIVCNDEWFDLKEAQANWEYLSPIRVLRHPFTDLSMGRPDGNYESSDESGFAVISINVAMLALQYRMWCDTMGSDKNSTHRFIAAYPITNMIASHLDVAIFNRMVKIYNEQPVAPYKKAHPFFIPDYSDRIDQVLRKQIGIQEYQKMSFDQTLTSIPLISSDTLLEAMQLPEVILTRQVKWALIVARIPLIKFLVKMNKENNNPRNTLYLSLLRTSIREITNDQTLRVGLTQDMIYEIENSMYLDIEAYL